ncbi:Eco57I restriction-modification methylase domain-containing protein [Flavobacterium sp.]|uniref:Eco57I restriction-modification methylase domain-containing protein n=1 Tax=Flavobacterium sp. TaxID=239 RepID=UPI002B4B52DD|nr:DNA methyltransferase [Flavobacterium sp.]HLF52913.1 DNA methyltransferase [Flavobacterium sp.]
MSLFQPSVLKKYLSQQDTDQVQKAYKKYSKYFHNTVIQENIRNSKEEQFQEGFLRELFVDILGYTLNPTPKFNLTTELKNIKGAKKVDGAILKDGNALAVIELKGTNTKDMESIRQQAFDYKANQTGCIYVITSNFEKLRFYINNAVDFEEFNLFTLSHTEFEIFYLCLAKDNILSNKPLSIKEASVVEEENITKKFYADYSLFKRELYRDLVKQNRNNIMLTELSEKTSKLTLFKKSQKLIDRFLFILFAEDRGLLAPNSINTILKEWKALADLDMDVPLYDRYKQYFRYLDTGRKGTDKKEEIFAYNGGLFQPDTILDAVMIDSEMLYRHTKKLSTYDFESQVDVNILGHIFEHSLNEIESVNAEIEGTDFDKQKTKRKKDGVFYTPKYITKYIVDNTIGKLCTEKKGELGIIDEEYAKGRKNRQATTIIKLEQQLKDYREWLLELTICDPACGSGAFLNQALDFLIREHAYIDELTKQLFGGGFAFPDIENQILEHNIYGVDLNEESIEIAKLSLWLRTAQPKRKLTSLNNNIKCGNSLIESKAIAGDKAFNWKEEFPEVFAKGGFDVIIGNPPYVRNEFIEPSHKDNFQKNFKTFTGKSDLYVFFFEKAFQLLKQDGKSGFIVSSKYTKTKYGKLLIDFLLNNTHIDTFIDFKDLDIFKGIIAYPSIILFDKVDKIKSGLLTNLLVVTNNNLLEIDNLFVGTEKIKQAEVFERLGSWESGSVGNSLYDTIKKIKKNHTSLSKLNIKPQVGIKTGSNSVYIHNSKNIPIELEKSQILKPYILGREVKKYSNIFPENKIIFPYELNDKNYKLIENLEIHTQTFQFLKDKYNILSKRAIIDQGIIRGNKKWYEYQQIKYDFQYSETYIIYPDISSDVNFTFTNNSLMDMTCFGINSSSKSLLGILNSNLIRKILEIVCVKARGGYLRLKSQYINDLPIPSDYENIEIENSVVKILSLNIDLQEVDRKFGNYFSGQYKLEKLPKKLENWSELSFANFITEINKAIKTTGQTPLTKKDEFEWLDLFEENKAKAQTLKSQIETTEKAIDKMVYELYGLSEEEIGIVENS